MAKLTSKNPKLPKPAKAPKVLSISGIATAEQIAELHSRIDGINNVLGDTVVRHGMQLKYIDETLTGLAKGSNEARSKIDGITKRLDKTQAQPVKKQDKFEVTEPAIYGDKYCVIGDKQSNCYPINRNWFYNVGDAEDHAKDLMRRSPGCSQLYVVAVRRVVKR